MTDHNVAVLLAVILLSALLHAGWNAMVRVEVDKDRAVVIAIACGTFLAAAVAMIRWSLGTVPFATPWSVLWSLVAGVLEAAYFTALARALTNGPLGPVYTISRGGGVLLIWPASMLLWSESLSVLSVIGSAVVLLGLVASGAERSISRTAVRWSVLCAALIAAYTLAYKQAMVTGGASTAVFATSLALASIVNAIRIGSGGRTAAAALFKRRWPHLMVTGATCAIAFMLLMEALARTGAGFVQTMRNTSVLFALLMAWFIGDKPSPRQVIGAVLVATGAIVLARGQ